MSKDLESMFICSHIVNEFNERLVSDVDSSLLLDFVHSFIYEIHDENVKNNLFYGENYIKGKYEKYNNNAGW
jgi:hypothetical protein